MADLLSHEELLLRLEVEDFFYLEADLLDEHRYEEWLDLLTEDIRYHAPMKRNVASKEMDKELTRESVEMSWFDEGKGHAREARRADTHGRALGRGTALPCYAFRVERASAGLRFRQSWRWRDTRQVPFPGASQPAGRRGQQPGSAIG